MKSNAIKLAILPALIGGFIACEDIAFSKGPASTKAKAGAITGHSRKAKDLFFEQLENPKAEINTGLAYSLELLRNGQTYKVDNKYSFKSGDRIKFHIKPNMTGYAYIVMDKGSTGKKAVLFPNDKSTDNAVKAGGNIVLPVNGVLTFDENPGTERVKLFVSRNPLKESDLISTPKEEFVLIASSTTLTEDSITEDSLVMIASSGQAKSLPKGKSKDLFFEEEPAVMVVNKNPHEVLAIEMDLKHYGRSGTASENVPLNISSK